ncbi:MAG: S8 family serine peptidase [Bacteroidota bacterium]
MKFFFTYIVFFLALNLQSQSKYAVELVDKSSDRVEDYIQHPEEMLSQRSIDRRIDQNIHLDSKDVPIDPLLIQECINTGAEVLSSSKWLNILYVSAGEEQRAQLEKLSFVKSVTALQESVMSKAVEDQAYLPAKKSSSIYGLSDDFIKQIRVDYLHDKGYTGKNIQIAVFDTGFPGVDILEEFKEVGVKGSYNFVEGATDVYKNNYHGTMVLSTMGVNKPGTYVGSAYEADYWLFTTEDINSETPLEEFNWIEAAEYADSVGADVINSSVGYYDYESPYISYAYEDMDGKTTHISKGATIAASRGILVVVSAGNEGNKDWNYIVTPSDAVDVLAVGAVDKYGIAAPFTSYGPSSDGRIKPDISAMGVSVPVFNEYGEIKTLNGTSFSSPITAGSLACLRQAFPGASVKAIIEVLHSTASLDGNTDDRLGYGIANFEQAYLELEKSLSQVEDELIGLKILPNPVKEILKVRGLDDKKYIYSICDSSGRMVLSGSDNLNNGIDLSILKKGYYQLIILNGNTKINLGFIK